MNELESEKSKMAKNSIFMQQISEEDLSIIVQGPLHIKDGVNWTELLIGDLQSWFPNAEVILSTWKSGFSGKFEGAEVVLLDDPGAPHLLKKSDHKQANNLNRQLYSSIQGIRRASKRYSVKIRSDMIVRSDKIISVLNDTRERHCQLFSITCEPVVVCDLTTIDPSKEEKLMHHPCDWIYAGLTSDLEEIFSVRPMSDVEATFYSDFEGYDFIAKFRAEAWIWGSFVSKKTGLKFKSGYSSGSIDSEPSVRLMVSNLAIFSLAQLGFDSKKHSIPLGRYKKVMTHLRWRQITSISYKGRLSRSITLDNLLMEMFWLAQNSPLYKFLKKPYRMLLEVYRRNV